MDMETCSAGCFIAFLILAVIFVIITIFGNLCLDFAGGSHRITPTAIDTDFWGNYKVYYKTSEYTKNSEEDFYYIEKENTDLKEQIEECIKNNQEIIVYYDKWVGFKGISAPNSAPITRIEIIEEVKDD